VSRTQDKTTGNLPAVAGDRLPRLPEGWCSALLGDIADITSGITKGQRHRRGTELREVPYLRVANVQRGFLDLEAITFIAATEDKIQALRLQVGDVLFTEGGDRDKLGRGWVWSGEIEECIHQNHIFRARLLSPDINPKFVSYHGNSFGQDWFLRNGKQTTNLASINQSVLRRFPVPIPPSKEQRRIVAKIEELFSDLDAGVAALERAKANLKRYRAAVLKAAVEGKLTEKWRADNPAKEPASKLLERILTERRRKWEEQQLAKYAAKGKQPPANWKSKYKEPVGPDESKLPGLPEGWCWATVGQVGEAVTGNTPSKTNPDFFGDDVLFVKPTDLNAGYYVSDSAEKLSGSGASVARVLPRLCVLVTCIGATIGKTGLNRVECATNQQINALMPVADYVLSTWLFWLFVSPFGQQTIKARASATTLPILNKGKFEKLPVPIPPADEQNAAVEILENCLSIVDEAEAQIEANQKRSSRLRQSILKRAFEGKLVPQDPTDEPAEVLLGRIVRERTPDVPKRKGAYNARKAKQSKRARP